MPPPTCFLSNAEQYSAWQEAENGLYSVCSLREEISFGKLLQEILLQISFTLDWRDLYAEQNEKEGIIPSAFSINAVGGLILRGASNPLVGNEDLGTDFYDQTAYPEFDQFSLLPKLTLFLISFAK